MLPIACRLCRSALALLAGLALSALAFAAVVQLAGVRTWPLELVHHFVPQYACAAAAVALVAPWLRQRWMAVPAAVIAVYFAAIFWTAPVPATAPGMAPAMAPMMATGATSAGDGASRPLQLITNNVYASNWRQDDLVAWLASRPADVIVLQEVNTSLAARLRRAEDRYPHRLVAEEDYVGPDGTRSLEAIAVLSRHAIIAHRPPGRWAKAWQATLARLDVDGIRPWIVAIHPPSPAFRRWLPVRDRFYRELATMIAGLEGPVVVAGDFNATPYTPVFRDFVAATGLRTFVRFPATYNDRLGPLGIAIDHVLVRGPYLAALRALEPVGSDHRPVQATIILPADAR